MADARKGRGVRIALAVCALAAYSSGCTQQAPSDAELSAALRRVDCGEYGPLDWRWNASGLVPFGLVLRDRGGEVSGPGVPELVARLEKAYGLNMQAARHLLAAALAGSSPECEWGSCPEGPGRELVARHLLEAARLGHGNRAIGVAASDFAGNDANLQGFVAAVLAHAPDPRRQAWQLTVDASGTEDERRIANEFLEGLPGDSMDRLDVDEQCATTDMDHADRVAAFCLAAMQRALANRAAPRAQSVPKVFDRLARALVSLHRHGIVLRLWRQLSPGEQRDVLALARADRDPRYAIGLAAVLLLAGDREATLEFLDATKPWREDFCGGIRRRIVAFHLEGTPFGPAYDALVCLEHEAFPLEPAWVILADPMWTDTKMAITSELGSLATRYTGAFPFRGPPPARVLRRAWADLAADDATLLPRMRERMAASDTRYSPGPDPGAATIARVLAREPVQPFSERVVPPTQPDGTQHWGGFDRELVSAKLVVAPDEVVRAQRLGDHVVALTVTQDLDEMRSTAGWGGYWLHESMDGGKTWMPRVYTGLAEMRPYVALPDSRIPLLQGGIVRIEVGVVEPQVELYGGGTWDRRRYSPLLLEARLDDLRRDSDHDGLTDVVEDRLLTDRENPDSDGDGLMDGADPVPHVARVEVAGEAARERTALVRAALGDDCGPHPSYDGGSEVEQDPRIRSFEERLTFSERRGLQWTFVEMPRQHLSGVPIERRTVVLTAEEQGRARWRLGRFASRRTTVLVDHGGKRALVIEHGELSTGFISLERREGCWRRSSTIETIISN